MNLSSFIMLGIAYALYQELRKAERRKVWRDCVASEVADGMYVDTCQPIFTPYPRSTTIH